ncbi:MAG: FAD-dependent oxidoreductase, partial [Pararhodobacter sp.]|nr:FAD-dependent oxidoreductase [Pararhodobacter sp.]
LCKTPFRQDYAQSVDWLERQARKSGVLMRLEQEMDAEAILKASPDVVIIATGANDTKPDIPGADLPHVATAREFINGRKLGKRVVVGDWDGRHMGMSVAETLAQRGHEVEVVTSAFYVGNDADLMTWRASYDRLLALGVKMTPLHELIAVEEDGVLVRRSDGEIRKIACEGAVLCTKGTAERSLYRALKGKIDRLHAIGDCWAPRQIEQAVYEGSRTGREI